MMVAPTHAELEAITARYAADRALGRAERQRPFLIVTPLGRALEDALRRALDELSVAVQREALLRDWCDLSTALYAPRADRARMVVAFAFVELWQRYAEPASVWWLDGIDSFEQLVAHKPALRARFGSASARIETSVATRDVQLHPFHVPDRERLADEQAIVSSYLEPA